MSKGAKFSSFPINAFAVQSTLTAAAALFLPMMIFSILYIPILGAYRYPAKEKKGTLVFNVKGK